MTTLIYRGRPFITSHASSSAPPNNSPDLGSPTHEVPDIANTLRKDSFHAALQVIDLCQPPRLRRPRACLVHPFNGCRCFITAHSPQHYRTNNTQISSALTKDMGLICRMCAGLESARSEVAVIEALERKATPASHTNAHAEQSGRCV
ncbi:hypothetical protein BJX99DRAFT_235010 [Aspergillus californicus]